MARRCAGGGDVALYRYLLPGESSSCMPATCIRVVGKAQAIHPPQPHLLPKIENDHILPPRYFAPLEVRTLFAIFSLFFNTPSPPSLNFGGAAAVVAGCVQYK